MTERAVTGFAPRTLVVGSYPPVPGPASLATLAAVRRCWSAGREVVVASPRPSAALEVVPAQGPAVGGSLVKLARRYGCDEVVVCIQPGWPFGAAPGQAWTWPGGADERAVRSLVAALSAFKHAQLVMTGEPGLAPSLLGRLWPVVDHVIASSVEQAGRLEALGAGRVEVVAPVPTERLPGVLGPGTEAMGTEATGTEATGTEVTGAAAVGPLEPGALLLATRARRLLGALARRLLGSRAPVVRARLAHLKQRASGR